MQGIKIAIIEDNLHDAFNLTGMLESHFPELRIMPLLRTYEEAIEKLPLYEADLLFMDINLPGNYTAFDILRSCAPLEFNIIFTTAYDKYAIEAIRASALDYLLKPFDLNGLSDALQRAFKKHIAAHDPFQDASVMVEKLNLALRGRRNKIMITSQGSILFIDPAEIIRIEANGAYSLFILANGRKITSSRNLQTYEEELDKTIFFRTHRSFLININCVQSLKRNSNGGLLTLTDGMEVNITKEKMDAFFQFYRS